MENRLVHILATAVLAIGLVAVQPQQVGVVDSTNLDTAQADTGAVNFESLSQEANPPEGWDIDTVLVVLATVLAPFLAVLAGFILERWLEQRREQRTAQRVYAVIATEIAENLAAINQLWQDLQAEEVTQGTPAQRLEAARRLTRSPRLVWSRSVYDAQLANLPATRFDEQAVAQVHRHYARLAQADSLHSEIATLVDTIQGMLGNDDLILRRWEAFCVAIEMLLDLANPLDAHRKS